MLVVTVPFGAPSARQVTENRELMIGDDNGATHLTAPSEGNFADSLHHPSTRVSKGSVGDHSTGVSRSLRCASLYELRPEPTGHRLWVIHERVLGGKICPCPQGGLCDA